MLAEERRQFMLDLLQRDQRIVAKDLAEKFQISVDSIRRDLTIMEEQGLLQKTYGGAVPPNKARTLPLPDAERYAEGLPYQNAISRAAVSYIRENDSIFIGGAGIQYGMLKYIPLDMPLTIVTNSLKVAQTIRENSHIEAYLIGGKLRAVSGNIIDSLAIEQIRRFSLDVCFLTGGGISTKGISTATPDGASFARAVSEISRRTIALAPHDKLGIDMFAGSVPLVDIDLVITDWEAPMDAVQQLVDRGVEVVTAEADHEAV